jgi:hypothetical protein
MPSEPLTGIADWSEAMTTGRDAAMTACPGASGFSIGTVAPAASRTLIVAMLDVL